MTGVNWDSVGTALGAISIAAGGIYAAWLQHGKKAAASRADIAESEAQASEASALGSVADAQQAVYRLLMERVTTLEKDMRLVRQELAEERQHSRRLVLHIWKLEQLMREANLTVPAFIDGEAIKP